MSIHPSWRRDGFLIATDPATTDFDVVCGFLAGSYWAKGLSRAILEQSVRAALVYNLIDQTDGSQAGFARVVTDHARIAWLSDVFVLEAYRGRGLGKWLVQTVQDDPRLATVRRWVLATTTRTVSTVGMAGRRCRPAATCTDSDPRLSRCPWPPPSWSSAWSAPVRRTG